MPSRDSNSKIEKNQPKFKFLEHKADAYIAAYGKTLKEAFEKINREMIKKLDYDDIIQKPFDSGKLVIKVKKILDKNTSP